MSNGNTPKYKMPNLDDIGGNKGGQQKKSGEHRKFSMPSLDGLPDKKKDGTSGESQLPTPDTQQEQSSLSNIKSVDDNDVAMDLADRFYTEIGSKPVHKKAEQYKTLVSEGVDPRRAAQSAGLEYEEVNNNGERLIKPSISNSDKELSKQAQEYVKQHLPEEKLQRADNNIETLNQQYFAKENPTLEDFEDYRGSVMSQIREKAKYEAYEDEAPSDEELLNEFESLHTIFIDAFERVDDAPQQRMTASTFGPAPANQVNTTYLTKKRQELRQKVRDDETFFETLFQGDTEEEENLQYREQLIHMSHDMLNEAEYLVSKMDHESSQAIGQGLLKGVTDYIEGYADIAKNLLKSDAVKQMQERFSKVKKGDLEFNDLSDEEVMMLQTMMTSQDVMNRFKDEVPIAADVSEQIGQMVGFMAEMGATAGIGQGVGATVSKNALKAMSVGRIAPSLSAKMSSQALGRIAQGSLQAGAMPNFVTTAADRIGRGEGYLSGIINGYTDNWAEVMGEKLFTTPVSKITKGANGAARMWNRMDSAFGNIDGVKSAVRNTFLEYTEEIAVGTFQGLKEGGLQGVGEFASDVRQQQILGLSVAAMGLGGGAINKAQKLQIQSKHKAIGEGLGKLKEDLDEVLKDPELHLAEVNDATNRLTKEYAKRQGIREVDENGETNPEFLAKTQEAKSYIATGLAMESWNPNAPNRENPALIGNEFKPKAKEGDVDTEVAPIKGDGFNVVTLKDGGQEVVLDNWLNKNWNKLAMGEHVSKDALKKTQSSLNDLRKNITDSEQLSVIDDAIEMVDGALNDNVDINQAKKDISSRPRVSKRREGPIEVDDTAESQEAYNVAVGQNMAGFVQQNKKEGKFTFDAYDLDQNKIGTYNSREQAFDAVVNNETPDQRAARQENEAAEKLVASEANKLFQYTSNETTFNENSDKASESVGNIAEVVAQRDNIRGKKLTQKVGEELSKRGINLNQEFISNAIKPRVKKIRQITSKGKSPSAKKMLGVKPSRKIVTTEAKALADKLRMQERGSRMGALEQKQQIKDVADEINNMVKSGKISAKQAASITKKLPRANTPLSKQRLLDYADRVFQDADYNQKVSDATKKRNQIKKRSKGDKPAGDLKSAAKRFVNEIDPQQVNDFNEYNKHADALNEALRGSSKTAKGELRVAEQADLGAINEYIQNESQRQRENHDAQVEAAVQEVTGLKDVSPEALRELSTAKQKEFVESLKDELENSQAVVSNMLSTGKDASGHDLDLSATARETVRRFMDMDIGLLDIDVAKQTLDALNHFITNGSIYKMDSIYFKYLGNKQTNEIAERGDMIAQNFATLFSGIPKYGEPLGNLFGKAFAPLPTMFENMFRGRSNMYAFMKATGLQDIINEKARVDMVKQKIIKDFESQFKDKKPHGDNFFDARNEMEREMYAVLVRRESEDTWQEEFDSKKEWMRQSYENLKSGDKHDQELGQMYEEVYKDLLRDAETFDDFASKVDKINEDAVQWWVDMWSQFYPDLAELSATVYNRELGQDQYYTPITYKRKRGMSEHDIKLYQSENLDVLLDQSPFLITTGEVDLNSSGVLMEKKKFQRLSSDKYIDLNFSNNMYKAIDGALKDLYVSKYMRQAAAAMKSSGFVKIFQNDRALMDIAKVRIKSVINDIKGRKSIEQSMLSEFDRNVQRVMDVIASSGANKALGGIAQMPKQTLSVAANTMINAGGTLSFSPLYDPSVNKFIDESGYAVANRGRDVMVNAERIETAILNDSKIQQANTTKKLMSALGKVGDNYLDMFLVRPDVGIARMSWITYYKKGLKKFSDYSNKDLASLNWDTHKLSNEAADYAQYMVDRQQNVSDPMLMGEFMKSASPTQSIIRKMLLPFSNFILNQKARMYTDVAVLVDSFGQGKFDTIDTRTALKSLPGLVAEQIVFNMVASYIRQMLMDVSEEIYGYEPTKDARQKRIDREWSYGFKNLTTDILSPLPMLDKLIQAGLDEGLHYSFESTPDWIDMTPYRSADPWQDFGTLGVTGSAVRDWGKMLDMTDETYTDEYAGKRFERRLPYYDQQMMKIASYMQGAYLSGFLPKEAGDIARDMQKVAKNRSLSDEEYQKMIENKRQFRVGDKKEQRFLERDRQLPEATRQIPEQQ